MCLVNNSGLDEAPDVERVNGVCLTLDCLGGCWYPCALGHTVHHLEVSKYRGRVYESLGSKQLDDGGVDVGNRVIGDTDRDVDQAQQLGASGDSDRQGRISDRGNVEVISESDGALPEHPHMGEHSVETLVVEGGTRGHDLDLGPIQAGIPCEIVQGHFCSGHVLRAKTVSKDTPNTR